MIRNLKALGLALCAVFAFGALSASASAEVTDHLTSASGSGTTFLTGSQIGGVGAGNAFGTKSIGLLVTCATGTYTGSYAGTTATSVEVTPAYGGCEIPGLGGATVTDLGCKYVLSGTTDKYFNTSNVEVGRDATVSLNCNHSGSIVIHAPLGCTLTFSDTHTVGGPTVNQNLLGVRYDNEADGAKWDVKVTVTIDKVAYTSNGACQAIGYPATGTDGFLTTNVTVKAYSNAAHTTQVNLTQS